MKYTLFFYGTIHKMSPHQNPINLSPKGEFLRTHRVGPIWSSAHFTFFIVRHFSIPKICHGYCCGGGGGLIFDMDEKFEIIEFSHFDQMSLEGVEPTTFEYADIDLTI